MNKIALKINAQKDKDLSLAKAVLKQLRAFCEKIFVEDTYRDLLGDGVYPYSEDCFPEEAELLLILGGDGTMLHAAQAAVKNSVPMLGVNMGRVGYLASVECSELSQLSRLAQDDFYEKEHMMLRVSVGKQTGEDILLGYALNDVVVDGKGHLADIRLYDAAHYLDYRADGLIVATPTGSTAYSFSAGGPVMDEGMQAICVTPVCPRSFFSRSLLFAPDSLLRVENTGVRGGALDVSLDGHTHMPLAYGESVFVSRCEKSVRILTLKERNLLEVLCTKMGTRHF